jgi:hypothetical protein
MKGPDDAKHVNSKTGKVAHIVAILILRFIG